jgi:hypothetical protein
MAWTAAQCEEYLTSLVTKWTDYGQRRRYAGFLLTECSLPADTAQSIATGLCALDQGEVPDVDAFPLPSLRVLWPDVEDNALTIRHSERVVRTYGITGGGWLTVRLAGGMLRIRASLRSDGRYGGGFGGTFEGFIRPPHGNASLAAAFLFGNSVRSEELTPEQVTYIQQQLRSGDGEDFLDYAPRAADSDANSSGAAEAVIEPE